MILALHIPDGFLSVPVDVVGWLLAILAIGLALRATGSELGERQAPWLGILAAFIFAAQAINFPVAAGTSGHLLGGALAAIVAGPAAAVLVMTCVIALQALLFQDGGLLVMGWNIVNMGVLTALVGSAVYRLAPSNPALKLAAAFLAAWLSVVVSSLACALELAASGTSPLQVGLPAMAGVHSVIGLGEALITVFFLAYVVKVRPDALAEQKGPAPVFLAGLSVALLVALCAPLASSSPDGLEAVAERQGFLQAAQEPPFRLLPDYTVPGVSHEVATTLVAVALGTVLVGLMGLALGRKLARRQAQAADRPELISGREAGAGPEGPGPGPRAGPPSCSGC